MRRVLLTALVLLGAGAAAFLAMGSGADGKPHYWVELDNAFGLVQGADLKVAGVRAGKITALKLDQRTKRALVGFQIDRTGFGSLRTDVRCDVRPQSLIGEYFVDCLPGTARTALKPGSTIPVSHTTSTVAPDLVNDILRLPYRERLRIVVNELGAAVAGNGDNLNAAIRRASPALRETDKVLAILANQNQVLADLTKNADQVVGDLAANRNDVARFVVTARNTAEASAQRRVQIAEGLRRLPGFLQQLGPAMRSLGNVADEQTPALRTLHASAGQLNRFFGQLGPFADASRPAIGALGRAAATGDQAVKAATPTVAELDRFATGTPELAKNLAIVLQHLDDRSHAVEADPRSPGGKGYTGLEALLEYVYDQTLSTNVYDSTVHMLKVAPIAGGDCVSYADVARAKKYADECAATLGPNQPGINFVDPTKPDGTGDARKRSHVDRRVVGPHDGPLPGLAPAPLPAPGGDAAPGGDQPHAPSAPSLPGVPQPPAVPHLPDLLPPQGGQPSQPLLPGAGGNRSGGGGLLGLSARTSDRRSQERLLAYLLAP
jgi:virulence factor Mce-like protein